MIEVIMPKMGDAMEEGMLVEWVKKEGDKVKSGDVIGSIQTDKATVELTAPGSGILAGLLIKEGETVPVGRTIGAILQEGETLPAGWASDGAVAEQQQRADGQEPLGVRDVPVRKAEEHRGGLAVETRVVASPLAKRLAREMGVDLARVRGTGPAGRIVEKDVRAAAQQPSAKPTEMVAPVADIEGRFVKHTALRRITAQRTAKAKQEVPHYYVTVEVDVDRLVALREQMNAENPEAKLSINDFIIKASALALVEQPHINASFEGDGLKIYNSVVIGIATAVPDGLTVPVIKNCESKTLRQIASEVRDLVERARENKLLPDELSGSTFSISNMGMFDVENFAAIINQPNGAIIAVATARKVPVVVEGKDGEELGIRTRMKITGSFDHRIIDGAQAAQFMGVLRKYLESPTLLLM